MADDVAWQIHADKETCGCCGGEGTLVVIGCVHEHLDRVVLCEGAIRSVERDEILCLPCLENRAGHPCILRVTRPR